MKKTIKLIAITAIVAVIGFSLAACDKDKGSGGGGTKTSETGTLTPVTTPSGGGGLSGLTFSDGLPANNPVVFILPDSTDTDLMSILRATESYIAAGEENTTSGNTVKLLTPSKAVWTGTDTYMVVVFISRGDGWEYIKNVSFSNGSATIKKSNLIKADW